MVAFLGSVSEKLSIVKRKKILKSGDYALVHWGQRGSGGDRVWKYRANPLDANAKSQRQHLCKYFPDPFSDLSEGWFQRCRLEGQKGVSSMWAMVSLLPYQMWPRLAKHFKRHQAEA